jgi:hypothetical protein
MRLCAAWQGNLHQSLSSHTCRTTPCIQTLIVLTETSDSSCHVLTSSFVLPRHQKARNVSPAAAPVLTASLDYHSRCSEPVRLALSGSALVCIIFSFWGWACLKTDVQDQRPVRTCLLSWSSSDRIFSCLQNTIFTCCITSGCVAQSSCVCCVSRERFTSRRQGRRYLHTIGTGGNAKSGGLPWRKRWTYIPTFWVHDLKDC